jgi:UDP-glucose-4-epimerase GalE
MQNPGLYYRNNVFATLELLEAMRRHHVNYFIFSSTAAVYGHTSSEPLKENALCNPINVYGKSKWMVEKMMADYERAYDFKFVIFRYFNAAGADPEGKLGEAHEPETHLIPRAIRVALGLESCLKVFGNTYPTFDGTAIRDYIHVTDLAEAHIQALNYLIQGGSSVTLNLGTGRGYSLKQVLDMVEQISSIRLDTELNPPNLEEPPCLIANGDLASSLLRWKPIYSDLETIVSTAFNWHRSFSK